MLKKYLLLLILLSLTSCNQQKVDPIPDISINVKNIIFMVGDGMGLAHINAARLKARHENKSFIIDTLPVTGLVNTHASNHLITDSAAAATALATGYKTSNKTIGMSPDGKKFKTILEAAQDKKMATGLVATSSITHATPAAFVAHVRSRKQQSEIAEQLLESQTDVLLGGGKAFFLPDTAADSLREDGQDLIAKAKLKGYTLLETRRELLTNSDDKILGLFAKDGLNFKESEPSLAEMTQAALNRLSKNQTGFILIVEGSQIDWASHHKNTDETIHQTILFDHAVETALNFAKTNGETLLLVTADHETGGMTINKGKLDGSRLEIRWTTKKHTAIDVPLYAYGPGAIEFTGTMDNTIIPKKLAEILNLSLD